MRIQLCRAGLVAAMSVTILQACDLYPPYVSCKNLNRIVEDESLVSSIWEQVLVVLANPDILRPHGNKVGVVRVEYIVGRLGLDWKELDIPLSSASIEVFGYGLRYDDFGSETVEGVRIGYGYRDNIEFSVSATPYDQEENGANWSLDDVKVNCEIASWVM